MSDYLSVDRWGRPRVRRKSAESIKDKKELKAESDVDQMQNALSFIKLASGVSKGLSMVQELGFKDMLKQTFKPSETEHAISLFKPKQVDGILPGSPFKRLFDFRGVKDRFQINPKLINMFKDEISGFGSEEDALNWISNLTGEMDEFQLADWDANWKESFLGLPEFKDKFPSLVEVAGETVEDSDNFLELYDLELKDVDSKDNHLDF
tara:strand:- start:20298 stop:20921 length:624 start_codon:yes stop_codon:yes gene_type:complete